MRSLGAVEVIHLKGRGHALSPSLSVALPAGGGAPGDSFSSRGVEYALPWQPPRVQSRLDCRYHHHRFPPAGVGRQRRDFIISRGLLYRADDEFGEPRRPREVNWPLLGREGRAGFPSSSSGLMAISRFAALLSQSFFISARASSALNPR